MWTLVFLSVLSVCFQVNADVRDNLTTDFARLLAVLRSSDSGVNLPMPMEIFHGLSADGAHPQRPFDAPVYQLVLVHVDDELAADVARLRL